MKVLIVDDDASLRMALDLGVSQTVFAGKKPDTKLAQDFDEAAKLLKSIPFDIAFIDIRFGDNDPQGGLRLLKHVRAEYPNVVCIMMTGEVDGGPLQECLELGASDYLFKPFNSLQMNFAVEKAMTICRLRRLVNRSPRVSSSVVPRTKSPKFQRVLDDAQQLAGSDIPVLIIGESGTGKEVIADYIHQLEGDPTRPIQKVHCGAIPENLLESELFGFTKGAFTGALNSHTGYFERAHDGDLFLDEIGTMSLAAQVKFLRALQSGEIQKIGSHKTQQIHVRVISASNENLKERVAAGEFREDLYYRIAGKTLTLPPLRDRKEDIPDLVSTFCQKYGRSEVAISSGALEVLMNYNWPGNIRELEQKIRNLVSLRRDRTEISADDVRHEIGLDDPIVPIDKGQAQSSEDSIFTLRVPQIKGRYQSALEDLERAMVKHALSQTRNVTEAANYLGTTRFTLSRRMNQWSTEHQSNPTSDH